MAAGKRILVVDDEERIVEALRAYLEAEGYAVSVAFSGGQALEVFAQDAPALVLLDLMLPDISGEEVCRRIRRGSATPVVMLTAKAAENDMLTGLTIGADDYIVKPASPKLILARVAAVLRRTQTPPPAQSAVSYNSGYLTIDHKNVLVKINGQAVDLTPTEFKLLACLAKTPRKAFTRDELITFALGEDYRGYDRTLDTYIKNLRKKIEPDPKQPQLLLTVHGVGYRFGGEQG
ncbi:MAG: response regulator transcription factor [Oscillospiraceae bacterium]|nr:response regulator transcription factor [Oscillospiraceae bacterium]